MGRNSWRKGKVKRKMRRECLRRQGFRCFYCETEISDTNGTATLDHVIPVSKGGAEFSISNCVAACQPCNSAKADIILDDHGAMMPGDE